VAAAAPNITLLVLASIPASVVEAEHPLTEEVGKRLATCGQLTRPLPGALRVERFPTKGVVSSFHYSGVAE
jgi:hypothetical protein